MDRKKRAGWLLLALAIAALDLWSKGLWQFPDRPGHPPILEKVLVEDWLFIRTTWNVGGVWSLPLPSWLLLGATLVAVPLLVFWIFRPAAPRGWESLAKACVLGGALGNLHDRMRYDAVRDFFHVHIKPLDYDYPTFNVADAALVGGILVLLVCSFLPKHDGEGAA